MEKYALPESRVNWGKIASLIQRQTIVNTVQFKGCIGISMEKELLSAKTTDHDNCSKLCYNYLIFLVLQYGK